MKWTIVALVILLLGLQVRLWIGDGSLSEVVQLKTELLNQQQKLEELKQRNDELSRRVVELQNSDVAIEEIARKDLGMIKKGETFYQIVEPNKKSKTRLQGDD